ncbi:MAG TPA: tetratricopeptide repeat protein, partial [Gammaproteobacteria bacterium]|nr:tetratricopeptide repeat protein [Gammaproteobacteria bacterium]
MGFILGRTAMTHNTSKEKRSNPVLKRATILAAQGKSDQALQLVQTHLGKFPRDIEALNLAGSFAAQLESWAQAEKFFLEVLARNKSNTYSLYNLAKVYKLSGQLNESISILMNLLEVEPGNVSALNEIGFLFTKTGDIESALHAFQKS